MTSPFKLLVHLVEQPIGQQRRQWSALRRASGPLDDLIPIDDVGVQKGTDQTDNAGIRDLLAQTVDQDVVVHPVEELLQVDIHHEAPSGLHERLCRQDGIVRTSARAEAVAVLAEVGIKDRLQDLQERLLDQAVQHRGDAELALAAPGFGIITRRTGCGRYVPFHSSSRIEDQSVRSISTVWSMSRPSTPAAPLLARTCFNARRRFSRARTAPSSPGPVSFLVRGGGVASSRPESRRASPALLSGLPGLPGI